MKNQTKTAMSNKIMDPIGKNMGLRYKSHPWHGVDIGQDAPETITSFIEMVPTDTVKYEIDKETAYLKIDRPQKYSNDPWKIIIISSITCALCYQMFDLAVCLRFSPGND